MPQGWVSRVEKDTGWIAPVGHSTEISFRHWGLAAEMGGRYPKVGDYVQYRQLHDSTRGGTYVTEVRVITPPTMQPFTGKNVYQNSPAYSKPQIYRVVDGERKPLEQAIREAAAEQETR